MTIDELKLGMKIRHRSWPVHVYGTVIRLEANPPGAVAFDPKSRDPKVTGRYLLDVQFKSEDEHQSYMEQGYGIALLNFEPFTQ